MSAHVLDPVADRGDIIRQKTCLLVGNFRLEGRGRSLFASQRISFIDYGVYTVVRWIVRVILGILRLQVG